MKSQEADPSDLEVSQLEGRGALRDGVGGLSEGPTGLLLSLGSDNLQQFFVFLSGMTSLLFTLALASLEASASAAMALWRFWGNLTSLTSTLWI